MNVVMLPMWLLSGIFFSSDRFPDMLQPVIRALPLTMLIDTLRAVILEGATLSSQAVRLAGLFLWRRYSSSSTSSVFQYEASTSPRNGNHSR